VSIVTFALGRTV